MHRGYVKLWRKSLDSEWLSNHTLWCFWCWCLLKATHKHKEQLVGYQKVQLEPGQFVFGIHKASKAINASPRQIRTCLEAMINLGNLTKKSTNKFSIISIVNWSAYQQEEKENDNQLDSQPTSHRQATDNKQECKEHKNVKKKEKETAGRASRLPADFILSEDLKAFASKHGINGNVETVFDQFCDHHHSRGSTMLDWKAAWRTWVRNEIKFSKGKGSTKKSGVERTMQIFAAREHERREQEKTTGCSFDADGELLPTRDHS